LVGIACWASFAGWRKAASQKQAGRAKATERRQSSSLEFVEDFAELYVECLPGEERVEKNQQLFARDAGEQQAP
jgi:hypothetical protein